MLPFLYSRPSSVKRNKQIAPYLRSTHITYYGATFYQYLLCHAVAALIWQKCFQADPFSRLNGELYKNTILVHGGGKDPIHMLTHLLNKTPTVEDLVDALIQGVSNPKSCSTSPF